jgi:hypothetical protein
VSEHEDAAKKAEEKKIEEQLLGNRAVSGRTEANKPPEQAEIDNAQRVRMNGPEASTGPQDAAAAKQDDKKAKRATAKKKDDEDDGERNAAVPAQFDDGDNGWGGVPVQMRSND